MTTPLNKKINYALGYIHLGQRGGRITKTVLLIGIILAVVLLSGCTDTDTGQTLNPIDFPPNTANEPVNFEIVEPLLSATVGQEYNYSFCKPDLNKTSDLCGGVNAATNPTGGKPPYHFQLDSGSGFPPMGLSLNLNGMLTGTPTIADERSFSVCAVDLSGNQDCKEFSLVAEEPAEVPESWTGTVQTWGRTLCNFSPSESYGGELTGSVTFTLTVPSSLVKALKKESGKDGIHVWDEPNLGTLSATETVASQSNDLACKLYGGTVSDVQFQVGAGYSAIDYGIWINPIEDNAAILPGGLMQSNGSYGGAIGGMFLMPTSISDTEISGTVDFHEPGTGSFTMTKKP